MTPERPRDRNPDGRPVRAVRCLLLAACVAVLCCGCVPEWEASAESEPVIFLLDSPVNQDFVAGRGAGLSTEDITHGSLVARVLRSYCRTRIVSIPVEGPDGATDRRAYLDGLRSVLQHQSRHPDARILVNISLSSDRSGDEEERLIGQLVARGVLPVAAAGNSDSAEAVYPAAYPGVIAVASATRAGKALHSNYGPHIDIAASGDISFIDYEYLPLRWLRRAMEARGTSFAAPRVAATLAYVLERRPESSPREAYKLLEATAVPVAGQHFRDGLLGAGLLDIRSAKTRVAPVYGFAHFVLPVCVWAVLGVVSVWLVVRRGFPGVILSALLWFVALPLSFLAAVRLGRWVEFVGRGDTVVGLGVFSLLLAGAVISLLVQRRAPLKVLPAAALPAGVFHVCAVLWPAGELVRMVGGGVTALAMVAISIVLERRARARVHQLQGLEEVDALLKAHRWSVDPRIRRAALDRMAQATDERVVAYLLRAVGRNGPIVDALARIAGRDVTPFEPHLQRFGRLGREGRRRLLLALRKAGNPDARPYLEQLLDRFPRQDIRETLEALERVEAEAGPDEPDLGAV